MKIVLSKRMAVPNVTPAPLEAEKNMVRSVVVAAINRDVAIGPADVTFAAGAIIQKGVALSIDMAAGASKIDLSACFVIASAADAVIHVLALD